MISSSENRTAIQSPIEIAEIVSSYREGYISGWIFVLKSYRKNELKERLLDESNINDALSRLAGNYLSINPLEISLSEHASLEKYNKSNKYLYTGYTDGRNAAFFIVEETGKEVYNIFSRIDKHTLKGMTLESKRKLLETSPKLEALLFLKAIINAKENDDNIKLGKLMPLSVQSCAGSTDVRESKNDEPKAETGEKRGDIPVKNQDENEKQSQ